MFYPKTAPNPTGSDVIDTAEIFRVLGFLSKVGICKACDSERAGYQRTVAVHYEKMLTITRPILDRRR